MKKRMAINHKTIILLFLFFGFFASSCQEYPEGPCISFRSAKNRFYGWHTITKYTVNGEDSLGLYYDSLALSFYFYYEDVYNNDQCIITGDRKDGKGCDFVWTWMLTNNNKILKIISAGGSISKGTGPFKNNVTSEWKILKLKRNDIIMKTDYNNKEYLIELKQ
jgi:hypothetical protein